MNNQAALGYCLLLFLKREPIRTTHQKCSGKGAHVKKIAFIDLEASGLGAQSWPIEVGWCFLDGEPETFLIAPFKEWSEDAWNSEAQALHGVSLETLHKNGRPISQVCQRLNEALADSEVYSDAPDWDGFWLYRLFSACDEKQQFSMHDFGELLGDLSRNEISALTEQASKSAPHRHRARDDVLHMRAIHKLSKSAASRH